MLKVSNMRLNDTHFIVNTSMQYRTQRSHSKYFLIYKSLNGIVESNPRLKKAIFFTIAILTMSTL
jgi:hypothetical protein